MLAFDSAGGILNRGRLDVLLQSDDHLQLFIFYFFKDMITYVPFERSLLEVLAEPDVMD